jgi:hypothetical protein
MVRFSYAPCATNFFSNLSRNSRYNRSARRGVLQCGACHKQGEQAPAESECPPPPSNIKECTVLVHQGCASPHTFLSNTQQAHAGTRWPCVSKTVAISPTCLPGIPTPLSQSKGTS